MYGSQEAAQQDANRMHGWNNVKVQQDTAVYEGEEDAYYITARDPQSGHPVVFHDPSQDQAIYY